MFGSLFGFVPGIWLVTLCYASVHCLMIALELPLILCWFTWETRCAHRQRFQRWPIRNNYVLLHYFLSCGHSFLSYRHIISCLMGNILCDPSAIFWEILIRVWYLIFTIHSAMFLSYGPTSVWSTNLVISLCLILAQVTWFITLNRIFCVIKLPNSSTRTMCCTIIIVLSLCFLTFRFLTHKLTY